MHKWLRAGGKEWLLLIGAALLFLAALLFPFSMATAHSCENSEIIRIHVIAHSNSPRDQTIKFAVRDTLISSFEECFAELSSCSCDEAFEKLQKHLSAMKLVASKRAGELGFEGEVLVQAGIFHFPETTNGDAVFPEGDYRAVRFILGGGAGRNWWCVLFPQLSCALSAESTIPGTIGWSSMEILQRWLLKAR